MGALFQRSFIEYNASLTDEMRANQPVLHPLFQIRAGYAESPDWMMVQVGEFAPEPLTVELFRRRAVYSAPGLTLALLELLASEKWLDRRSDAYYVTEAGKAILANMVKRRATILGAFSSISDELLYTLAELMGEIINASLQADNPPGTWCLAHSRNRAPDESASPQEKIVQYCGDFNAFRDDAHMAAYGQYGVDGHAWEALVTISNTSAHNVLSLFDQLAYRGFAIEDWQHAVYQLKGLGWLRTDGNEKYLITTEGQFVQKKVESLTDRYFYAPWQQIGESKCQQMINIMQHVTELCTQTEVVD